MMLVAILKGNFTIADIKVILLTKFLAFINMIGTAFMVVDKQYHLIVN